MVAKINIVVGSIFFFFILWPPALPAQVLFYLNFERDEVRKFPARWSSRDSENMVKVYSVWAEGGNKFLHADAREISVQIGYEKVWELKEFPILRWRWRAHTFPAGSDERKKSGNDSVLGVYVVFGGWPIPQAIKYIWSHTLLAGTTLESPHSSKTKIVVVRSGTSLKGEWVNEERDILADYRRLFGESDPNPTAKGIALLSDSDNTGTQAVGDYDDIMVTGRSGK